MMTLEEVDQILLQNGYEKSKDFSNPDLEEGTFNEHYLYKETEKDYSGTTWEVLVAWRITNEHVSDIEIQFEAEYGYDEGRTPWTTLGECLRSRCYILQWHEDPEALQKDYLQNYGEEDLEECDDEFFYYPELTKDRLLNAINSQIRPDLYYRELLQVRLEFLSFVKSKIEPILNDYTFTLARANFCDENTGTMWFSYDSPLSEYYTIQIQIGYYDWTPRIFTQGVVLSMDMTRSDLESIIISELQNEGGILWDFLNTMDPEFTYEKALLIIELKKQIHYQSKYRQRFFQEHPRSDFPKQYWGDYDRLKPKD